MHTIRTVSLSLGLAAFIAMAAHAAPPDSAPRSRGPATFSEFDPNGDGKVTEQEFNERRAQRMTERAQQGGQMRNAANAPAFSDLDTDKDGAITPDEFTAHQSRRRNAR